jgi:hypothetical protein
MAGAVPAWGRAEAHAVSSATMVNSCRASPPAQLPDASVGGSARCRARAPRNGPAPGHRPDVAGIADVGGGDGGAREGALPAHHLGAASRLARGRSSGPVRLDGRLCRLQVRARASASPLAGHPELRGRAGLFLVLVFGACAIVCRTLGRRRAAPVKPHRRTFTRWLSNPRLYVPMLVLVGVGWAASYLRDGGMYGVNGSRAGLVAVADSTSLILSFRGGWPSREWVEREHLRAIGGLRGDDVSSRYTLFGFGVLAGQRFWNGNQERVVWHRVIALPWWFLLLLSAAAPLEQFGRWLWSNRRSERRRRQGCCLHCGYDLTGNVSGCVRNADRHPGRAC